MSEIPIGELSAQCKNCGGTEFTLPDEATDETIIICNGCGQSVGTVAEFKAAAFQRAKAAMPDVAKMVQAALFGGGKSGKIK